MRYEEKNMNLFDVPDSYMLAHCISSDCLMLSGIAVEFQKRFKLRKSLYEHRWAERKHPVAIRIGRVYNLITKKWVINKPSIESLRETLIQMREQALQEGVTDIAMPKIGCGVDRLKWEEVCPIIQEVFKDTKINIHVCYLGK